MRFKKVHPALVEGTLPSAWLHGCVAARVLLVQRSYLPMRKYSPLSAENAS